MIFQKKLMANAVGRGNMEKQWAEVCKARELANNHNKALAAMAGLHVNEGLIPRDVYQDFDNVTVQRMRSDDGDTFLNDLLPMSRSVNIGKLVQQFRRASDAGSVQTSMTGQTGVRMDQTEFSYDGSIIPIHDAGFGRNWREWNAMQSEGFDALIDDQREVVASVRQRLADSLLDGHSDKDGNTIVVDGFSWTGMRNDSRVAQVDLGIGGVNFDFTDQTKTGDENKNAFIQVRDVLWITNKCERDATYYVSREIMSNWERKFSTQYDSKIIMQELADLMGVAAVKVTSKLTGNQLMAFPLDDGFVRPVTGMGVNTVAMPRTKYNDDFQFVTWAAVGWQVRVDFSGNTCALYASA